jgi:hypothetical protein
MDTNMPQNLIKKCNLCQAWFSADDIVYSPDIKPLGVAFMDEGDDKAYYFFQHTIPACGTSFVVCADDLTAFIAESIPAEQLTFSEDCEGHCVRLDDLRECHQECRLAPYRRFLLHMITLKSPHSSVSDQPKS